MELLIPSLTLILFAVAIAYFLLPKFAPAILITGSAVVLGVAMYLHWSRFGVSEYERATWQDNLRRYASWVVLAVGLLFAYMFYLMNQAGGSTALPQILQPVATPALPAIITPTVGGGFDSLAKNVSSRINSLMRF